MELGRSRAGAAAATLVLAALSAGQGCQSWRPVTGGSPAPRGQTRVQSAAPFLVIADPPGELVPGSAPCRATLAEGDGSGTRGGDTVTLGYLARVVPASSGDQAACAALREASVVIRRDAAAPAAPAVTVRRVDKRRTALWVGVTVAVVVAFLVHSFSNFELDGGGGSCDANFC